MVATINKGIKISVAIAILLTVMFSIFVPVQADAAGIPDVTITSSGMTVKGDGFDKTGGTSAWTELISKYRAFIMGISGIAAITMVVIFIFQFLKLGASAGNPQARSQALVGVLWSGIAAAGLGAVTLIVGLFYRSVGG